MPSWNIHLEAGERLADKLKLSGIKRKKFLLGCILPDINNGYINQVESRKPHNETHFARDQKSSLNFYAEYKKEVDKRESIFLGYLFHLYTDGFFNYEFYREIKHTSIGKNLTFDEKQSLKRHDYWIYDTNFEHQIGINSEEELKMLASEAARINEVRINPHEIMEVEEILRSKILKNVMRDREYTFYTKEKLDTILDKMIFSFEKDYLGGKSARTS